MPPTFWNHTKDMHHIKFSMTLIMNMENYTSGWYFWWLLPFTISAVRRLLSIYWNARLYVTGSVVGRLEKQEPSDSNFLWLATLCKKRQHCKIWLIYKCKFLCIVTDNPSNTASAIKLMNVDNDKDQKSVKFMRENFEAGEYIPAKI